MHFRLFSKNIRVPSQTRYVSTAPSSEEGSVTMNNLRFQLFLNEYYRMLNSGCTKTRLLVSCQAEEAASSSTKRFCGCTKTRAY